MAEEIIIDRSLDKKRRYEQLLPQIAALTEGENDLVANLSNIAAALKYGMDFFWVGFYFVKPFSLFQNTGTVNSTTEETGSVLVLGPFQGPVACTRISYGKGVCGTCWKEKRTIIVEDVEKFPGHIACSSASRSEIVLPVFNTDRKVIMVIDIDSDKLNAFDETDKICLEQITELIEEKIISGQQ